MNPFEVIKALGETKEDTYREGDYSSFMVNRGLSYFQDCIYYAAEMNCMPELDERLQFDFYLYSLPKRRRFSKWSKEKIDPRIDLISEATGMSRREAKEILRCVSDEELKKMKEATQKGGKK